MSCLVMKMHWTESFRIISETLAGSVFADRVGRRERDLSHLFDIRQAALSIHWKDGGVIEHGKKTSAFY